MKSMGVAHGLVVDPKPVEGGGGGGPLDHILIPRRAPSQLRQTPPEEVDTAIDAQRLRRVVDALPQEDAPPFRATTDGALDPLPTLLRPADATEAARDGLAHGAVRGDVGQSGVRGPLAGGHGSVERLAGGGENDGIATEKKT